MRRDTRGVLGLKNWGQVGYADDFWRVREGRTEAMRKHVLLWLAVPLTCLFSPNAGASDNQAGPFGKYLFECSHDNSAWLPVHRGFYVDREGNVYQYERTHGGWEPEESDKGYFAKFKPSEMDDKYEGKELVGKVDKDMLGAMVLLIVPASNGRIIRRSAAADAGGTGCDAFLYDAQAQRYSMVELGTTATSDVEVKNTSKEAEVLLEWLIKLDLQYVQPRRPHVKEVRIVPAFFSQGKPDGFKIFAIRPGSHFYRIGLQNGDAITKIDGTELKTVEQANMGLQLLLKETKVGIDILRGDVYLHLDNSQRQ
jgi:hypothetical protein